MLILQIDSEGNRKHPNTFQTKHTKLSLNLRFSLRLQKSNIWDAPN